LSQLEQFGSRFRQCHKESAHLGELLQAKFAAGAWFCPIPIALHEIHAILRETGARSVVAFDAAFMKRSRVR